MRNLSSTVTDTPSSCVPSRSVVSKISTASGNMVHPFLELIVFAPHHLGVAGLDRLGHWAGAGDGSIIHRVHRRDLGRRARHEHLLRQVEVAAGELVEGD